MALPRPSKRDYDILGVPHNATVARCLEAFRKLEILYDPRAWPGEDQVWAINMQDEADEAMAFIYDCQSDWARRVA
jgi:DnaJ-class molecular chaperone